MRVKIFSANSWKALEDQVNQWLETHLVTPDSMRVQFSTVSVDVDETAYKTEHTLVLFYVPMTAM